MSNIFKENKTTKQNSTHQAAAKTHVLLLKHLNKWSYDFFTAACKASLKKNRHLLSNSTENR